MRISPLKTAVIMALCFFLVPLVFAADGSDQAAPSSPADLSSPAELLEPAEPENPAEAPVSPDLESQALPEAPSEGEEPEGEAPLSFPGDAEEGGEDWDALPLEDSGAEMTVYYDDRTGTDYVEIRTAEQIEEYHYLSQIRYSDLIFVLSDLLRRITRDGYQWAKAPEISYEKNEEVALLYRRDLVDDIVYGIVQFPDFKVFLSALREPDEEHPFNAENGRDMMTLVFSFAACLAQAEQALGIDQLEYTMQFFKQD
jgi:hypothetical protein